MFKEIFNKQESLFIGVDIGSYSVKAVLLEQTEDKIKLLQHASESMPKGAMNERDLQDIEAVGKVLARLRKKFPKQHKEVAVAISGSTVITKTVYMDVNFTDEELATQIEIEADSLIPYPIEEVSLDFERLAVNSADPSKVDVLLSAARTESVEARVSALDIGGFNARIMDVEAFALARAAQVCLAQLPEDASDKLVGLVDIGANMTLMSVLKGDKVLYTRDQSFGGDAYTKNIVNYYNKTYDEAELAKLTKDLPPNYTFEVLAPFQTAVIQQIRRAIQMFLTSSAEEKIDYLILSGGTALVEGIQQVIEDELGLHCVIADPFAQMLAEQGEAEQQAAEQNTPAATTVNISAQYMIATGLAMRSIEPCHI
ncbi:type IV pilus assembly protein PilM [Catenovulum agarivorans DS-2]|uniref:Type IV pilus assembly protein PilM n=1 Tax=Catenovulum agarivorans DS-2 TaxID=1328313 RepID=W7QB91_9ALTE|nr:pilus assembly protein PilM [Catenovulum agarivorans]EWH09246.1 type IV pilus assembly protein PilM [Catenovulum agarivorans DS-2]